MNKKIGIILATLLLLVSVVLAVGLTNNQRAFYNDCKENCSTQKHDAKQQCNRVADQCMAGCSALRENCTIIAHEVLASCKASCPSLPGNLTETESKDLQHQCERNCTITAKDARGMCIKGIRDCNHVCSHENADCKRQANVIIRGCIDNCYTTALAINSKSEQHHGDEDVWDNQEHHNDTQRRKYCEKERPEHCLAIQEPVCSSNGTTYPSGCVACANEGTTWYTAGPCV